MATKKQHVIAPKKAIRKSWNRQILKLNLRIQNKLFEKKGTNLAMMIPYEI
jgi:hypothetical protein